MEWKEHVGWIAPFLATSVAYIVVRHASLVSANPTVCRAMTVLLGITFGTAVAAAALGAFIDKVAPNQFLDLQ